MGIIHRSIPIFAGTLHEQIYSRNLSQSEIARSVECRGTRLQPARCIDGHRYFSCFGDHIL